MRSYAFERYKDQKGKAKKRGIDFLLTFEEWDQWWLSNGVDKNIQIGFIKNALCMCRKGDTGPYMLNNIYCAPRSQNTKDSIVTATGSDSMFAKTLVTPKGVFNSKKDAVMAYRINTTTMARWLKKKPTQFYYKEFA